MISKLLAPVYDILGVCLGVFNFCFLAQCVVFKLLATVYEIKVYCLCVLELSCSS